VKISSARSTRRRFCGSIRAALSGSTSCKPRSSTRASPPPAARARAARPDRPRANRPDPNAEPAGRAPCHRKRSARGREQQSPGSRRWRRGRSALHRRAHSRPARRADMANTALFARRGLGTADVEAAVQAVPNRRRQSRPRVVRRGAPRAPISRRLLDRQSPAPACPQAVMTCRDFGKRSPWWRRSTWVH